MTKPLTNGQKVKNGMKRTSAQLMTMREALEADRDDMSLVILDFATARRAIDRVHLISDSIQDVINALRNAETMALPANKLLMMSIDLPGAVVFLNNIDLNILGLALGRCEPRVLDFLRAWLEVSGVTEQIAELDKDGMDEAIPTRQD